ncbi:MAG TPA: gliding motility-associated ABC transporter substrate-binding protein GldG [Bacteroidia bacterium]|jgi:ABC-2 type transport system permease protein|nr:gliding motility-associated ABC transporter substrate-binding protein GldG [Bacteroidia bacterium]
MQVKRNKRRDLISLGLMLAIFILLNVVSLFLFHRFDLTSEKRYTLSPATKKLLTNLDDVVYVKVYLDGDFPAGFKQLRNETREMLDEFRVYSKNNIEYEFINPSENPDKKQQNEIYKQLADKGLQPFNVENKTETGTTQQIIWPGAIVSYRGHEVPWLLLKTQQAMSAEAQLNNSVQALEYEFASCIRNLTVRVRPTIGFIQGHGELDTLGVYDIAYALNDFYTTKQITINEQLHALDGLKAIVIAKPDSAFSEKDKFIIDQFIMKGGKVLWAVDPLYTNLDTLVRKSWTMAFPRDLKLTDMLFKYGVRINQNMVLDLQSAAIPINTGLKGQKPHFEPMPWMFAPLAIPTGNHPISKNVDLVKLEYAASLDTVTARGINKTILLQSSRYSKTTNAPVRIYLQMGLIQPDERQFTDSYRPFAVLLEGEFESVYKNRIPPQIANDSAIGFRPHGEKTKMIVISDGDILHNELHYPSRRPVPLGYDALTNRTYGNKNFILNCINYLCDDSGLIDVRARELTLRLLDRKKLKAEAFKWKLINTLVPLLSIAVIGILIFYLRKRKYTS